LIPSGPVASIFFFIFSSEFCNSSIVIKSISFFRFLSTYIFIFSFGSHHSSL
jgi:hypothetical protein